MTARAGSWVAATASVRGASHERSGKPNQDAVRVVEVDGPTPGLVAAVCDGHGGDRYVRSDVGSRFGVEVACAVGRRALSKLGALTEAGEVEQQLRTVAVTEIVERWRQRVVEDVAQRPFTDAERRTTGAVLEDDPLVSYGATLVMAILGPAWVALLQVGDGDVTVLTDGRAEAPVPGDDRLVGGETTSLCLPTAVADTRVRVMVDQLPDLVLLTSDGYANSFASPTWRTEVGNDLATHVERLGIDRVEERLPSWLADSAAAAGDDVSMALIHRVSTSAATGAATGPAPDAVRSTNVAAPTSPRRSRKTAFAVGGAVLVGLLGGLVLGRVTAGDTTRAEPVADTVETSVVSGTVSGSTEPPVSVATTAPPTTVDPEAASSSEIAIGPREQVHTLIGEDGAAILVFDQANTDADAEPRLIGWASVADTQAVLPEGWALDGRRLTYDEELIDDVFAVAWPLLSPYVWAISQDRRTVTAYDMQSGDPVGSAVIVDRSGNELPDESESETTSAPTQRGADSDGAASPTNGGG